jgi:hypothetical protein
VLERDRKQRERNKKTERGGVCAELKNSFGAPEMWTRTATAPSTSTSLSK